MADLDPTQAAAEALVARFALGDADYHLAKASAAEAAAVAVAAAEPIIRAQVMDELSTDPDPSPRKRQRVFEAMRADYADRFGELEAAEAWGALNHLADAVARLDLCQGAQAEEDDIRADERRKVAEQIAADLDEIARSQRRQAKASVSVMAGGLHNVTAGAFEDAAAAARRRAQPKEPTDG